MSRDQLIRWLGTAHFKGFGWDRAGFVDALAGGQAPFVGGFKPQVLSLARRNLSPLSAGEITALTNSSPANAVQTVLDNRSRKGSPVQIDVGGSPVNAWLIMDMGGNQVPVQFVKGAAYAGCSTGWRIAGTQRLDTNMDARVVRNEDVATTNPAHIRREQAFHVNGDAVFNEVIAANLDDVDTIEVSGPGLSRYSGNPAQPLDANAHGPLTLTSPADTEIPFFVIGDGTTYYQDSEALQSCTDLASLATAQNPPPAGTPCIDETRAGPGSIYIWALKSVSDGSVVAAFPIEVESIPLSKKFALSNGQDLFATISSITPASIKAINIAIDAATGTSLDGVFSYTYTHGDVYGSKARSCSIVLQDSDSTSVFDFVSSAERDEVRCMLSINRGISGSLDVPSGTVDHGFASVATRALGNFLTTSQSIPLQ